jgi:hypothetical protein
MFVVEMNNLTGHLVVDGFEAMSLIVISVLQNNLTGTISEIFGHLKNLTELYLYGNNSSVRYP